MAQVCLKEPYNNHWLPGGRQVCVRAFIGVLYELNSCHAQTLPGPIEVIWWPCSKGSVNDTISVLKFPEDGLTDAAYFNAVKEATELCALSLQRVQVDPMADGVIIGITKGISVISVNMLTGTGFLNTEVTHFLLKLKVAG